MEKIRASINVCRGCGQVDGHKMRVIEFSELNENELREVQNTPGLYEFFQANNYSAMKVCDDCNALPTVEFAKKVKDTGLIALSQIQAFENEEKIKTSLLVSRDQMDEIDGTLLEISQEIENLVTLMQYIRRTNMMRDKHQTELNRYDEFPNIGFNRKEYEEKVIKKKLENKR